MKTKRLLMMHEGLEDVTQNLANGCGLNGGALKAMQMQLHPPVWERMVEMKAIL